MQAQHRSIRQGWHVTKKSNIYIYYCYRTTVYPLSTSGQPPKGKIHDFMKYLSLWNLSTRKKLRIALHLFLQCHAQTMDDCHLWIGSLMCLWLVVLATLAAWLKEWSVCWVFSPSQTVDTHLHAPLRTVVTFSDHLTFLEASPAGWHVWFWVKCINNYWVNCQEFKHIHVLIRMKRHNSDDLFFFSSIFTIRPIKFCLILYD